MKRVINYIEFELQMKEKQACIYKDISVGFMFNLNYQL